MPRVGLNTKHASTYVPLVSLQTPQLNVLAATIWTLLMSALLILVSCFSSTIASSFGISVFYPLIWGDLKKGGPAYFLLIGSATCFFFLLTVTTVVKQSYFRQMNPSHRWQLGTENLARMTSSLWSGMDFTNTKYIYQQYQQTFSYWSQEIQYETRNKLLSDISFNYAEDYQLQGSLHFLDKSDVITSLVQHIDVVTRTCFCILRRYKLFDPQDMTFFLLGTPVYTGKNW